MVYLCCTYEWHMLYLCCTYDWHMLYLCCTYDWHMLYLCCTYEWHMLYLCYTYDWHMLYLCYTYDWHMLYLCCTYDWHCGNVLNLISDPCKGWCWFRCIEKQQQAERILPSSQRMCVLGEKVAAIASKGFWSSRWSSYVMLCAIWYHLYNFKNVKSTHGGVLPFVKLQGWVCYFNKSNTPLWVFFTFLKFYKWYQIPQSASYWNHFFLVSS